MNLRLFVGLLLIASIAQAADRPGLGEIRALDAELQAQLSDSSVAAAGFAIARAESVVGGWKNAPANVDVDIRRKALAVDGLRQAAVAAQRDANVAAALRVGLLPVGDLRRDDTAGATCEHAIELAEGTARRTGFKAQESLWFKVSARDDQPLRVSTRGSAIDAALAIFSDCRATRSAPLATSDDAFGLQAEVLLEPRSQTFWYARVSNLGDAGDGVLGGITFSGIAGRVTQSTDNAGVANVQLTFFQQSGSGYSYFTSGTTDAAGNYSVPLPIGTYVLRTGTYGASDAFNVLFEAYDNRECLASYPYYIDTCGDVNQLTPVAVTGPLVTGIDFALSPGATIGGRVTQANPPNAPIAGAFVQIYSATRQALSSVQTDSQGRYRAYNLGSGNVYMVASSARHASQLYQGLPCPGACDPLTGTPIPLAPGAATVIDVELQSERYFRVDGLLEGQSSVGQYLTVEVLNSNGALVASAGANNGRVFVGPVEPGNYYLRTRIFGLSFTQLNGGIDCASDCFNELLQATPVPVGAADTEVVVSVNLRRLPVLRGHVTQQGSTAPIADATVIAHNLVTGGYFQATTDAAGAYLFPALQPGTYTMQFQSQSHTDELFDNVPCERLDPATQCPGGTLIALGLQALERTVDAQLTRAGSISGRATVGGVALAGQFLYVDLLSSSGAFLREYSAIADADGNYRIDDVPAGGHLVGINYYTGFAQLYDGVNCPRSSGSGVFGSCPFAQATLVTSAADQTVDGIDFDVLALGSRRVHVVNVANGTPLANVSIDVWRTNGIRVGAAVTAADGFAYVGVDPYGIVAMYSISTDNTRGFVDEVYDNRACPLGSAYLGLCSLVGASNIALPVTDPNFAAIEIALSDGDGLFGGGFE